MLGSSSHSSHQDQNHEDLQLNLPPPPSPSQPSYLRSSTTLFHLHHHQIHHQEPPEFENNHTPPSIHLKHLLFNAAQMISRSDLAAAHRLITVLSANSSAYGDSSQRLIHSFTKALSLRLRLHRHQPPLPVILNIHPSPPPPPITITASNNSFFMTQYGDPILQSSYISLNQITPFVRFCHLTANQAILEAIDQSHHHQHPLEPMNIHILDFNIMQGVQWPPLMQAITDRQPPPTLRITATGTNLNFLRRTGDRLSIFAHSLGLRFRFYPLLLLNTDTDTVDRLIDHLSTVIINPNETLAVNCVLYLHRHLKNRDKLCLLLRKIKSLNPKVVTLAEQEANHNHPIFIQRFSEAMSYYTAVFESLEATQPPNSGERIEVEQVWFGREIADIVAEEGDRRIERHERFRSWEVMMRSSGFRNVALSSYALSQAKLLLRLHYPSEGYNHEVVNDSFFLGWKNQPLFSVSSWH